MPTLSYRSLVLMSDCNGGPNLFGGRMMQWMDLAAGMYAQCHTRSQVVTRLFREIEFAYPVPLGWVCEIYTHTVKEGSTSLTVGLTVLRKNMVTGESDVVTETEVVMVAVESGENGKLVKKAWRDV